MLSASIKSSVSQLSSAEVLGICTFLLSLSMDNPRTYEVKLTKYHVLDRHDLCLRLADLLGKHFTTDQISLVRCALFSSPFTRKQLLKLECLLEHMV